MNINNLQTRQQNDKINTKEIRRKIINHSKEIREKHSILKYQNALGLGILCLSISIIIISSLCYLNGYLPWWVCLLINTLCISVVHEIEHDLIHSLYFKTNRIMYNIMMALVWTVRPSTANPWVRKKIHLKHHQMPGTYEDLEERLVSNGQRWGLLRLWMISDFIVASTVLIIQGKSWKERNELFKKSVKAFFPFSLLHSVILYSFILFSLINMTFSLLGVKINWSETTNNLFHLVDVLMVIIIAPNLL